MQNPEQSDKIAQFLEIVGDCPDKRAYRLVRFYRLCHMKSKFDFARSSRLPTGTLKEQSRASTSILKAERLQ
jgi:hypothetical protein